MKNLIRLLLVFFVTNSLAQSKAQETVARVYIDRAKNVHVVLDDGRDKRITKEGHMANAKVAPDSRTVGWLKLNRWIAEGDIEPQASELGIYRNGKTRYIECGPFIRAYWFWMDGKQVATDCGGRHFAGTLTLYDSDTLLVLESFFQPDIPEEKRPAWSKAEDDSD